MKTLKGKNIFLRALEPQDLDYLYEVENDESLWEVGNSLTPYSRYILEQYIANGYRDIFEVKQLRLVICENTSERAVGFVDLYDFDPEHRRTGIGIVIYPEKEQRKGFAYDSLQLICSYAFNRLNCNQVYAGITADNEGSVALFEKMGFQQNGIKKSWTWAEGMFKDELFYQLFKD